MAHSLREAETRKEINVLTAGWAGAGLHEVDVFNIRQLGADSAPSAVKITDLAAHVVHDALGFLLEAVQVERRDRLTNCPVRHRVHIPADHAQP